MKEIENKLVDGRTLLEMLFAKNCRPCMRWLRNQQRSGKIPATKIGRLVFFDPEKVRQLHLTIIIPFSAVGAVGEVDLDARFHKARG
jgi:hypothetical protein